MGRERRCHGDTVPMADGNYSGFSANRGGRRGAGTCSGEVRDTPGPSWAVWEICEAEGELVVVT